MTPADDIWLSGPLVAEGRSVVAPVTAGGTAHDFLRVNFDTRVYRDGKARVDVSVENLLDKVGATTVTYDATIVVNNQVMFAKRAVQHFYLTRWRKVFEIGSAPLAAVTPDLGPFNASRALPTYLSLVTERRQHADRRALRDSARGRADREHAGSTRPSGAGALSGLDRALSGAQARHSTRLRAGQRRSVRVLAGARAGSGRQCDERRRV